MSSTEYDLLKSHQINTSTGVDIKCKEGECPLKHFLDFWEDCGDSLEEYMEENDLDPDPETSNCTVVYRHLWSIYGKPSFLERHNSNLGESK